MERAKDPGQLVQTAIDLGQKSLGPTQCPSCGMIYTSGHQADDKTHARSCKTRFVLGKRKDILRRATPHMPETIDEIIADSFTFAYVSPAENTSTFVRNILRMIQPDHDAEKMSKSAHSSPLTPLHRVAICIGSTLSPTLQNHTTSDKSSCILYAFASLRLHKSNKSLAQLEMFWVHPLCAEITLQTDIYQGILEVLQLNAIFGYTMKPSDINTESVSLIR